MGDNLNLTLHDHNDHSGHGHSHGDGSGHSHGDPASHSSIDVEVVGKSASRFSVVGKFNGLSQDKKIALLVAISLTILAVGSILFAVIEKTRQPYETYIAYCQAVEKHQRFDCGLSKPNDSRYKCKARGCCWDSTAIGFSPKCYSSSYQYRGYKVVSENHTNYGINLKLRRHQKEKLFQSEVDELDCIIGYETDSRVHVKIVDPAQSRYEVPVEVKTGTKGHRMQYVIGITQEIFGFSISRTHSNNTVINTTLPGMMFSDQYLSLSMALSSTHVYGLGEDEGTLLRKMQYNYHSMWNNGKGSKSNFGSHPFFLNIEKSGHACGVLLLNSNAMDVVLTPYPAVTFRTTGGILDFYIFLGPTPADVINQYTEQIGRPMLPPYWALGYHLGRYNSTSVSKLNETIQGLRAEAVPFDSIWTDNDLMVDKKSFTVNSNYSELHRLVKDLKSNHQYYVPVIDVGIKIDKGYDIYTTGEAASLYITNNNAAIVQGMTVAGTSVFPDYFNPGTQDWWCNALRTLYTIAEYGGVWLNFNEPYTYNSGGSVGCTGNNYDIPPYKIARDHELSYETLCPSDKHYGGALHYNLHNIYGWKQTQVTENCLTKTVLTTRPLIMSRSTFPGSGVSCGHWLGENTATWPDMKASISGMLNFNLFGISLVGADVCGYHGNAEEELCVRWHQLGALSPFFRNYNSAKSKDQYPTSFSKEGLQHIIKAIYTRYTLLPTLYTFFYQAHTTGSPVVRPLFFEFPDDDNLKSLDTQYLLGAGIMVVPTLEKGVTELNVYFPEAHWYDYYSGALVTADAGYKILNTTLEAINLYVRGGSVLVLAEPGLTTQHIQDPPLKVKIFLVENMLAEGSVYFDDGITQDTVSKGMYMTVGITATHEKVTSKVALLYPGHNTDSIVKEIAVMGLGKGPDTVLVNAVEIDKDKYTYLLDKKLLYIKDLSLPIKESFCVEYS